MKSEYQANEALQIAAMDRARWAAVLAPVPRRKPAPRPGLLARIFSR